jgi:hypothetical protein
LFGPRGAPVDEIRESKLFRSFTAEHPNVEVWADTGYSEGGWSYFWIVDVFVPGSVHNLAYVRTQDGRLERRTYDEAGDDLWVAAE